MDSNIRMYSTDLSFYPSAFYFGIRVHQPLRRSREGEGGKSFQDIGGDGGRRA